MLLYSCADVIIDIHIRYLCWFLGGRLLECDWLDYCSHVVIGCQKEAL